MVKQGHGWRASALAVALFLGGCAVSGPPFQRVQIPEGKSVIYAYRPSSIFGAALKPAVSCGAAGFNLARGGYHPFIVDPGTTVCRASTEATSEVDVECKTGEERYVKEEIGWGFFVGRPHLYVMDNATGESEIQDCRLQEQ